MLSCVWWSFSIDVIDVELWFLVCWFSICVNNSGKIFVNVKFVIYGNMDISSVEILLISNWFKNVFM